MFFALPCDCCDGEGFVESAPYGYDPRDGALLTHTYRYRTCDGSGWVEEEPDLLSLEDALGLDAEIARAKRMEGALL